MMGVDLSDHDSRYAYSAEWLDIVRRIWAESEAFDYEGRFFNLKDVLGKPKPFWGSRPILVSAGNSDVGRVFAASNADCLFTTIPNVETLPAKLDTFRAAAPPGQLRTFSPVAISWFVPRGERRSNTTTTSFTSRAIKRPPNTRSTCAAIDWRRISRLIAPVSRRLISGAGYPIIGSYDDGVEMFQQLGAAGWTD